MKKEDSKIESYYFHKAIDRAGSESTEHYHTTFEIYYMKEGSCKYFINDSSYEVVRGDVIFIPAGVIHRTNYGTALHSRILINFSEEYIPASLLSHLTELDYLYRSERVSERIDGILSVIESEYTESDFLSKDALKCLTGEILFLLMRNRGITKHTRRDTVIENTVKYIQQNYMHDIRLYEVAKEASVSAEHLSRIFKQNTGFGFSEYVTLVRLQRAEYMLKNEPGKSISEIAYECGFNDGNYFSYKFKQHYGISPSKARGCLTENSTKN